MGKELWLLAVSFAFLAAPASGASVEDFYKGKAIRIVAGQPPGGATDTNARLLQKVLSKYIPGNPNIVIENKPGGGSMLAANTVYNTEAKDGTVIAAFSPEIVLSQAIGAPRRAYEKALADPELRKAAEKMKMDLSPKAGEDVSRIVQELLNTPKPVLAWFKEVIQ